MRWHPWCSPWCDGLDEACMHQTDGQGGRQIDRERREGGEGVEVTTERQALWQGQGVASKSVLVKVCASVHLRTRMHVACSFEKGEAFRLSA